MMGNTGMQKFYRQYEAGVNPHASVGLLLGDGEWKRAIVGQANTVGEKESNE